METSDDGTPRSAGINHDEGSFNAPILALEAWCGACGQTMRVHLGLDPRPCTCGGSLVEIAEDGQRWRRAGPARDLGAILGRHPKEAPRDGTELVGWFSGRRQVTVAKWDGYGWLARNQKRWERVDVPLLAWLPMTLEAIAEDAP